MNLEELRKSMESDATIENKKLKDDIKNMKDHFRTQRDEFNHDKSLLLDDCRALANRCFALTQGSMCIFCELHLYQCPHALSLDEKILLQRRLMKESKK